MVNSEVTQAKPVRRQRHVPWYQNRFFKYASGAILILTIIFLFYQVTFLVTPIFNFFSYLFAPIVISFLFYYLLRPIVYFFEKYRVPRPLSVLVIYIIFGILLILFLAFLGPMLSEQTRAIVTNSVETIEHLKDQYQQVAAERFNLNLNDEIEQRVIAGLQQMTNILGQNIVDLLGILTRIATVLAVIPFIVFYLLKEDHDFAASFLHSVPEDFGKEVRKILRNLDSTLSSYINGLVLVSLTVGVLLFFGYLLIGLKYALILSIIAIIFMTIPFLGPFLAIIPALLSGLSQGSWMTLKVAIVFIFVQQLESNIISPQIIGQRLNIHPLTIILLLLAAGSLYGLPGLLLATPFYALGKVLIDNLVKIYRLRYPAFKANLAGK